MNRLYFQFKFVLPDFKGGSESLLRLNSFLMTHPGQYSVAPNSKLTNMQVTMQPAFVK